MKTSYTSILRLIFACLIPNCFTSLLAQPLIADYPLTTNSLDNTNTFGPITYGTHATPPPSAACTNGGYDINQVGFGTFSTPDLKLFFNKKNFQIDADFTSNGSNMPVFLISSSYRTIGVYISNSGMIGLKYNNSNYIYSTFFINAGQSYHVSLKYESPGYELFVNNSSVLAGILPPLTFPLDGSVMILAADGSNAHVFNGCINNLRVFSACTVNFGHADTDATCNEDNGTITFAAVGGSGDYQYSIDNGTTFQDNNVFSGLAAQTYQAVVQDKRGPKCISREQDVLIINNGTNVQVTATTTPATCNQNNGSITINSSGGSGGDYQYSIDNGTTFQNANVFSGLTAKTYQVVVQDNGGNNCKSSEQGVIVTNNGSSLQAIATATPASCNQNNGTITINASGGSGGIYQYSIDNGTTFQDANVFSGLAAQTYHVLVQDKGGYNCKSGVQDVAITNNGSNLKAIPAATPATCNQNNGTITINASGGSGGIYQYSIDNGTTFQDANVFSNLRVQTYQVVVKDKGGSNCKSPEQDVTITNKGTNPQITFMSTPATCNLDNATITINATGGSGSYQYSIDNGTSFKDANVFSTLKAQTYGLMAQDKIGNKCKSAERAVTITRNISNLQGIPTPTPATCNQNNGTITIAASGGSGSYQYSINNGSTVQDANVFSWLAAQTYKVVILDKGGDKCTSSVQDVTVTKTITELAAVPGITYNDVIVTSGQPFTLTARPNIGHSYLWIPPDNLSNETSKTPLVTTVADITYSVIITGDSGCIIVDTQRVLVAKPLLGAKDSVVVVPQAFTPNNNGRNDRLKPIPYNIAALRYFRVFNRWGQLLFETSTVGDGWDGTHKGKPQPTETYSWTLECTSRSGKTIKQSGSSLLIR